MAYDSNLSQMLRAIDLKDRNYWDNLSDEQKKKHSSFLAFRWAVTVNPGGKHSQLIESYYIQNANATANKHYYSLNKHPKLQWFLLTCISPGVQSYKHEWLAFKGKAAKNKRAQLIADLMPEIKLEDAEHLDKLLSDSELENLLREHGWQDNEIKKALKGKNNDD